MNPAKAFEQATAKMLRRAELGEGVMIIPYQSPRFDNWKGGDFYLPLLDIRFATESVNADQQTLMSNGLVTCLTKTEDDLDHAAISSLYDAVYNSIRSLFVSALNGTGEEFTDFSANVNDLAPDMVNLGGIELTDPSPPETSDGVNIMSVGFAVHFTYA